MVVFGSPGTPAGESSRAEHSLSARQSFSGLALLMLFPPPGMPFPFVSFPQFLQHLDGDVSDPSREGIGYVLTSVIRPKPHYIKSLCFISLGSSEPLEKRDLILLHACTILRPAFLPLLGTVYVVSALSAFG